MENKNNTLGLFANINNVLIRNTKQVVLNNLETQPIVSCIKTIKDLHVLLGINTSMVTEELIW